MNPTAIVFFAFGALVGYLINGTNGALTGLAVTMGLSLLVTIFSECE